MNNKLKIGLASFALVGTLGFGAIASAAGGSNGDTTGTPFGTPVSTPVDNGTNGTNDTKLEARSTRPKLTTEQRCAKSDEMLTRAAAAQSRMAERKAALQAKRAEAETAGNTDRVARIDQRLAHLEAKTTRLTTRLAKANAWISANCSA